MSIKKGGENLPDAYLEKRAEFLKTKEVRLQEQLEGDREVLQRRHDDINKSFRDRCDRLRSWEQESQRRHKEDRDLYASRRKHEEELAHQHQERQRMIQQRHHDAAVSATFGHIATLEGNIRRLGLDEDKPPVSNQQASAAVVTAKVEPLVENANRVADIRRRKELDIAARRDKLQRQYVAQQQQMLASKDVLRLQQVQAVVAKAAGMVVADREQSLAARRRTIEAEVNAQLNTVFLDGEKQRCLASFHETDKAFAAVAASQRAVDDVALTAARARKAAEEEAAKSTKRGALYEFFGAFVDELAGLAVDISARNFIQLTDGTTLRRPNPPTALEWRNIKEEALATAHIIGRIDGKKVAVARANTMSAASPRAKRGSSVNFGSFATAKPLSAPSPSSGGGIGIGSVDFSGSIMSVGEATSPRALLDDVWDTDEPDHILEVVSERDKQLLVDTVVQVARSAHQDATIQYHKESKESWGHMIAAGAQKADKATNWWNTVLTELPPTAVFVFGDALSGVQLLSDGRYVRDGDSEYVISPTTLLPEILAAQPPQAQVEAAAPTVVSPTQGGKGGKGKAPAAGAPRPSSAKPPSVVPSSAATIAPSDLAVFLSKRVAKHHRHQLEALAKRDNASGYPPSLLLVGFPMDTSSFAMDFNAALERELEEEEKLWAPLKLLTSMEHNTPRGGGGIGTHRSSIAGGQTNPNTPHGSLFSGAGGPGGAASHGSGSPEGTPSLTASGPRHRPPPAAFSVSAGKHHAAALANYASSLFFPPARISTVLLEVALPNLVERYQRVQRVIHTDSPQPQIAHEVWAPLKPLTGGVSGASAPSALGPMWASMSPTAAYEWVDSIQATWRVSKQVWLETVQAVHKRPPVPVAQLSVGAATPGVGNLNQSISSQSVPVNTSLVPSGLAPPVHACAGRLTRVLHFVATHTVDHLSTQDPIEVTSQILAQEVRALAKGTAQSDDSLASPLLAPLTLQCFSIPDATLDDLLVAYSAYEGNFTRWSITDVLESVDRASNSNHFTPLSDSGNHLPPLGSSSTDVQVTVPDAVQQRVEELRQGRIQSFRAIRELEVESGRCLHQAYLYTLCLLESDAFTQVHTDYHRAVGTPASAHATFQNQVFWKVCDTESLRVRSLLANAVGVLSNTIRRLQCAHVRTAVEAATHAMEEATWLVVASVLEAQRRHAEVSSLEGDTTEGSNTSYAQSEARAAELTALSSSLQTVLSEETILEALDEVHEHGVPLENVLEALWAKVERSWMTFTSQLLGATCGGGSSGAFGYISGCLQDVMHRTLGVGIDHARSTPLARIAPQSANMFASLLQHEQLRKHLSSGSTVWCSYLFQRTSALLGTSAHNAVTLRPRDFNDIMIAPELPLVGESASFEEDYISAAEARRALVISDVTLQHLCLHAQMSATTEQLVRGWVGLPASHRQGQFEHMILSAQVSELHLHVPSSIEELVAPLLVMLTNASTQQRSEGTDTQPPPRLFLPTWWAAPISHATAGGGGPKGALISLEKASTIFRRAARLSGGTSDVDASIDVSLWLSHLCTGQLVMPVGHLQPGVADRVYHLDNKRCATPNLLQLRQLVSALDAHHRGVVVEGQTSWAELPWWPLLTCGGASAKTAPVVPLVLRQLYYLLGPSEAPVATRTNLDTIGGRPLATVVRTSNLLTQMVRYLLSLAVGSGPTAVLEASFAIAASLRGPLTTRRCDVAPQATHTVSHMKAYVSVELIASALVQYHSDWSAEDLEVYLLLSQLADGGGRAARSPTSLPSPTSADGLERPNLPSVPIKDRSEEINFSSLNATHIGTRLLQLRTATSANCTLPSSEIKL